MLSGTTCGSLSVVCSGWRQTSNLDVSCSVGREHSEQGPWGWGRSSLALDHTYPSFPFPSCLPGPTPPSWTSLTGCIMMGSCRPAQMWWTESAFAAGRVSLGRCGCPGQGAWAPTLVVPSARQKEGLGAHSGPLFVSPWPRDPLLAWQRLGVHRRGEGSLAQVSP